MAAGLNPSFADKTAVMLRALQLARSRQGFVEPNPCVGAVLVDDQLRLIAEGCHEEFGGPHAEVVALRQAGEAARGATLFVTLEPCNHQGKTPPCSEAVIAAGVRRVVIGARDPKLHGAGEGLARLQQAGVQVSTGVCAVESQALIAPFAMLATQSRPYVHAKWAMTLDGKLATRTGHSQWISNELSRARGHALRGRMDAVLTGIGTVLADDPLLTARPPGPRVAARVILDSLARLPLNSQLVRTAAAVPVLLVTTPAADAQHCRDLQRAGVEILVCPATGEQGHCDLHELLQELGRRQWTNILLEAGGTLLGAFHDARLIDEVHCFLAPALAGGARAVTPLGGHGVDLMSAAVRLEQVQHEFLDGDIYLNGRILGPR